MEEALKTIAQANKLYALANYEAAVDLYAQATEKLATINGEDNPKNADVLFLYGRTLFKIAMQRSEVLGRPDQDEAGENNGAEGPAESNKAPDSRFSFQGDETLEEETWEDEHADEKDAPKDNGSEDRADAQDSTAEDDFQNAWEILDLARVSFQKQLDAASDESQVTDTKKKIAEIYDILGEIALENENFDQAVSDFKTALELKKALYSASHSQRSGAHYILALALEYCTSPGSREAAAKEVEAAINCFNIRLSEMTDDDKNKKNEREMLGELKLKLSELQAPPETINREDVADIFGKEEAVLKDTLVEAMQTSNDLSGLVRKKEKKRAMPETGGSASNDAAEHSDKKAKLEDAK